MFLLKYTPMFRGRIPFLTSDTLCFAHAPPTTSQILQNWRGSYDSALAFGIQLGAIGALYAPLLSLAMHAAHPPSRVSGFLGSVMQRERIFFVHGAFAQVAIATSWQYVTVLHPVLSRYSLTRLRNRSWRTRRESKIPLQRPTSLLFRSIRARCPKKHSAHFHRHRRCAAAPSLHWPACHVARPLLARQHRTDD